MTQLLRILAWPVATGLGFGFVVWFYELTDQTAMWREIDQSIGLSQTAWFVAPALAWFVIPAGWGRPKWPIWTLAAGGVAIFAAFGILVGLFMSQTGMARYTDFGPDDFLFLFERIGDNSVDRMMWLPAPAALYLMAPAFGFALVLGMISRALAGIYLAASAIGSVVIYLFYEDVAIGAALAEMGWNAGLGMATPAFGFAALSGLFGAAGILAWAVAIGPDDSEDDERW